MRHPIRFVGIVEPGEMFRAYLLAWRSTWQMWARHLFFVVIGGFVIVAGFLGWLGHRRGDDDVARLGFVTSAAGIALLVTSAISLRRRIARALHSSVFNQATGEARIEEQGVVLEDPQSRLQIAWEKFAGFRTSDDIVVYYVSYPRTFLAFFRWLASSSDEWNRLLEESERRLKRL